MRNFVFTRRIYCSAWLGIILVLISSGCASNPERAVSGRVSPASGGSPSAVSPASVTATSPAPSLCAPAQEAETLPTPEAFLSPPEVSYDAETNTIWLRKTAPTTLAAVSKALDQPQLLRELVSGEWLLSANLSIGSDATLRVASPEVRWLKLHSDKEKFVSIKVLGGRLDILDVCVSSWDTQGDTYDMHYEDGRSFVLARDGGHMEIHRSELRNLGYDANESYGLAWRMKGTSGQIIDSRIIGNYYGLYTHRVSGLVIRGNEVASSIKYGIDPHTSSNRLLIEHNLSHHNGKHGIILAEKCSDSIIRNNVVYSNALHGIVLYEGSDDNVVENNVVYSNQGQGINVNNAHKNTLHNNTVYGNGQSGIGVGQDAKGNLILGNTTRDNNEDGIYIYNDAEENELRDNVVTNNKRYGIYIKSRNNTIVRGNEVSGSEVGVFLNVDRPPEVSQEENHIYNNRQSDIRMDKKED